MQSSAYALSTPDSLTPASFFDLCSLIDACVILDHLAVLDSPDDLSATALTWHLGDAGLLSAFRPSLSRSDLRRVLLRLPADWGDRLPSGWAPGHDPDDDRRTAAAVTRTGAVPGIDYDTRLDDLLTQFEQMLDIPSMSHEAGRRMWRSLGYLVVAATDGLDYFPDYDRVPFTAASLARVYRSLPTQLYRSVSDALGQRINAEELVSEWTMHATLAIPAASALVLHRSRSLSDVPHRILEVREEFAGYRRHFGRFKVELQQAETLKDRARLLRTYQALLQEASGPHSEIISVGEMLNFAQATVKAAAGPTVPTSYSASLVTQPAEWLRRWWRRRPLAILFRLDGKLPTIPEYRQLIPKLWGTASHERLLDSLATHPAEVERSMRYF